jgi:HK97 family phage portal protein
MGAIRDFFFPAVNSSAVTDVDAALRPFTVQETLLNNIGAGMTATRGQAMSIPAIQRAQQIICSTIGSLPLEQYVKATGAHVEAPRVIHQPDPSTTGALIYAYTASDLFFYGAAFWQVTDSYAATDGGRVRSAQYIPYERISPQLDASGTKIIGYYIDNVPAPLSGVGSIIPFYALSDGLLFKAGRTIRAALALEEAAERFAKEPIPTMVLKSTGTNLPAERISNLMNSWKAARSSRATAFLNADVDISTIGYDPKNLQLNEARQYIALELSRACGLPAHFLSAEVTTMTYSNTLQERRALVDFSLRPILTTIEQTLSQSGKFIPAGYDVRFDLDDFLRGSALERAQVYEILNRIGAMSVEQIQEEEDLIR